MADAKVPDRILAQVRSALAVLREIAEQVARVRATIDGPVAHGNGRYEADVLENTAAEAASARDFLASFRDMAARNGVDAQAVILAEGGEPDLTPSEAARGWMRAPGDSR